MIESCSSQNCFITCNCKHVLDRNYCSAARASAFLCVYYDLCDASNYFTYCTYFLLVISKLTLPLTLLKTANYYSLMLILYEVGAQLCVSN
jgi:hypothetical protein